MTNKVWSVKVMSWDAATALGSPSHVGQVEAICLAPSRVAFARVLIAAKLASPSEAAASREIATMGGETRNSQALAAATEVGQVYVARLDAHKGYIPWPPT